MASGPKPGASTNFATLAFVRSTQFYCILSGLGWPAPSHRTERDRLLPIQSVHRSHPPHAGKTPYVAKKATIRSGNGNEANERHKKGDGTHEAGYNGGIIAGVAQW